MALKGRAALLLACALAMQAGAASAQPTDYERELAGIGEDLSRASGARAALLLYHRASLTGDYADFRAAEAAIDASLEQAGPSPELYLLRAHLDFKLHRLARARDGVARLADSPPVQTLLADLDLQEGRYDEARRGYENVLRTHRTWDNLSRLAFLESRTGRAARAEKLYAEAQEEITVKEMRAYAWVELQRGLLDLDRGRVRDALAHYQRADRAYSGYWLIEEHIAEALNLLGHTDEAIVLYRRIVERTRNPEFVSALAALVRRTDPAAAEALDREAERLFEEQSRLYPEAALGHFLEHLIERKELHPDLLALAERNHRLRPNGDSKLLLAKAHLKLNQPAKAKALLEEILETPWRTPEVTRLAKQLRASQVRAR